MDFSDILYAIKLGTKMLPTTYSINIIGLLIPNWFAQFNQVQLSTYSLSCIDDSMLEFSRQDG